MRRDLTGQTRTDDEERRGLSYLQRGVSMTNRHQAQLICAWTKQSSCQTNADTETMPPHLSGRLGCVWVADSSDFYSSILGWLEYE